MEAFTFQHRFLEQGSENSTQTISYQAVTEETVVVVVIRISELVAVCVRVIAGVIEARIHLGEIRVVELLIASRLSLQHSAYLSGLISIVIALCVCRLCGDDTANGAENQSDSHY